MALKKSELYSSLGAGCGELRGDMDARQYRDYVLVLLFIRCVSDKYAGVPYAPINYGIVFAPRSEMVTSSLRRSGHTEATQGMLTTANPCA
jgi:hypothetical protein